MSDAAMLPALTSPVLQRYSQLSNHANIVPIDSVYLPVGLLPIFHALAVSYGTLLISGHYTHNRNKVNVLMSTFLNLTLLFGSVIVTSALLAQPSPILLAPKTIAIYAGVHILNIMTGLGSLLVSLSGVSGVGMLLDIAFALADALCRSEGIAMLGVESVRAHSNPQLASSAFACIVIGTIVGAGGFLLIGAFTFERENWTLRTPMWLHSPSLVLTFDVVSSFVSASLYHYLTAPGATRQFSQAVQHLPANAQVYLSSSVQRLSSTLQVDTSLDWSDKAHTALLSREEAIAACALLLFSMGVTTRLSRGFWAPAASAVESPPPATPAVRRQAKQPRKSVSVTKTAVIKPAAPAASSTASPAPMLTANGDFDSTQEQRLDQIRQTLWGAEKQLEKEKEKEKEKPKTKEKKVPKEGAATSVKKRKSSSKAEL